MSPEEGVILEFPDGLLGFPTLTHLRLFEPPDGYPLKFLQSVERDDLSFIALDIAGIKPEYTVPLSSMEAAALAIEQPEDALILTLVVIPEDPRQMTTNLAGPLVINARTRKGRQIALTGDQYPLRHPILGDR
jgi:flagellar assembly factor FliW